MKKIIIGMLLLGMLFLGCTDTPDNTAKIEEKLSESDWNQYVANQLNASYCTQIPYNEAWMMDGNHHIFTRTTDYQIHIFICNINGEEEVVLHAYSIGRFIIMEDTNITKEQEMPVPIKRKKLNER